MAYDLFIGDRTFSSWSLRGWLMLEKFNLPYRTTMVGLYSGTMAADLAELAPARTVPAMRTPHGGILTDSLAMAETLHEENPQAGLYPADPAARALARSMVAEMHSGYGALRSACAMNLDHIWHGFAAPDAAMADLARIETLWSLARARHGADGPWLFGRYTLADVFLAPVAMRITTYGLPVSDTSRTYVAAHLDDLSFRQWRAMGQTKRYDPFPYSLPLDKGDWPGTRLSAKAVDAGTPVNDACPYSGKPVTHLMELDGRIYGFCNAFCRDKTVADPQAWPKFTALLPG